MPQPRRPHLKSPESLEYILDRAGESRFARARPPIPMRLWREAVGPRIAERAQPISLWSGVLVLRVSTSVWAHELSLLSEEVCARLRERGVEARQLRFFVGAIAPAERPPERRIARAVPRTADIPRELAVALGRLSDAGLRSAIAQAAASNLAWQSAARPAPAVAVSEALRGARAPRSAEEESARQDRTSPASRGGGPGTRANGPDRSR
jgi:hypothetical protein